MPNIVLCSFIVVCNDNIQIRRAASPSECQRFANLSRKRPTREHSKRGSLSYAVFARFPPFSNTTHPRAAVPVVFSTWTLIRSYSTVREIRRDDAATLVPREQFSIRYYNKSYNTSVHVSRYDELVRTTWYRIDWVYTTSDASRTYNINFSLWDVHVILMRTDYTLRLYSLHDNIVIVVVVIIIPSIN